MLLEGVLLLLLKHLTSPFLKLASPPLAFSHTSGTASLPPSAAPTLNPAARTSGACRSPAKEAGAAVRSAAAPPSSLGLSACPRSEQVWGRPFAHTRPSPCCHSLEYQITTSRALVSLPRQPYLSLAHTAAQLPLFCLPLCPPHSFISRAPALLQVSRGTSATPSRSPGGTRRCSGARHRSADPRVDPSWIRPPRAPRCCC